MLKKIANSLAEDVFKQWKLLNEQQDINSNGICQKRDNQYQETPVSNTECGIRTADAEDVCLFKANSTDLVTYQWGGYSNTTKNDKF